MNHLAAILAVERALVRRGISPATAADAAREAWIAAWARSGGADAPGLRGRPLLLAARRLAVTGRGGASRACAPLPSSPDLDPSGAPAADALDDLLDAAALAASSVPETLGALRRAGASLAAIGAACGVTGEAARGWVTGRSTPSTTAVGELRSFLRQIVA